MKDIPSSYLPADASDSLLKLGQNIRRARKLRSLSQQECADRALITRVTLARLERGSPGVSVGTLARILWVFGEVAVLGDLLNLANDNLAQILVDRGLPKYVRHKKDPDEDF